MSAYALIQNNAIINVVNWDGVASYTLANGVAAELLSSFPAGAGVGWTLSGSTWSAPVTVPQTQNLTYELLTQLFTAAELTAILSAAVSKPVIITWFLKMAANSGNINLTDPAVTTALNYLVAQGLITSARETAILAGTVMNPGA